MLRYQRSWGMIDAIEALYPGVKEARATISAAQAAEQWEPPPATGNAVQLRNAFFEGFRLGRLYDDEVSQPETMPLNEPEKRSSGRPRGSKNKKKGQPEPPVVTKTEQPDLTGVIVTCPVTKDAIDTAFCLLEYGCPGDPDTCTPEKYDEGDQI